jgi:Aspartyl protease
MWANKGVVLALVMGLAAISSLCADDANRPDLRNELPVHIYNRYQIVAEGSVGNVHGLHLLLDTGTTTTSIDRRIAKRLGVAGQRTKVVNFDKVVPVEWGIVSEITLGLQRAVELPVLIEDLSYLHAGPSHIDAIIGLDLLRRKTFVVDYVASQVSFGATDTTGMHAAPMRLGQTTVTVQAVLDGRPVWMIADTGLLRTTLYEKGIERTLANYRVKEHLLAHAMGGVVENRLTTVLQFRLGDQQLDREVLFIAPPAANQLSDIAGFLGPASFNPKQVVFDFDSNQLLWKS